MSTPREYSTQRLNEASWILSRTNSNDQPWEISNPSTSSFRMDRLHVETNSNFVYPFRLRVVGGWIGMTQKQLEYVLHRWMVLNFEPTQEPTT